MSQRSFTLFASWMLLTTALLGSPQATATPALDWKGLETAWNEFAANPSAEAALKAFNFLPKGVKVTDIREGFLVINKIFDQIGVLEEAAYSGEINAIRLGFGLFTISYGTFEAALNRIVGNLVRFKAEFFLQELSTRRDLIQNLDPIVGSFLNDYPDDPAARQLEKKLRIKALEAVEDKALKSLRNECIKILKKL